MAKATAFILIILIFWLQYHVWYGENSLYKVEQLQQSIAEQKLQNSQLKQQNELLKKEILLVRNEPKILEEKARENLGLIKQDEVFYRIIPAELK